MRQRVLPALALVSLAPLTLSLVACGSGGTPGGGTDTTLPAVISVTPTNGTKGVTADASIVVTFSEPMDQASTQSAYQSGDLLPSGVTFSWNAASTVMTVKPNAPLVYAKGTTFAQAAKTYNFSLTGAATDKAGNRLPLTSSAFSTLRDITATMPTVPSLNGYITQASSGGNGGFANVGSILIGDTAKNEGSRGFLTFDLSDIPTDVGAAPISATINLTKDFTQGSPYLNLTTCVSTKIIICLPYVSMTLEHVLFGSELLAGVSGHYGNPALHDLGAIATYQSSDSLKTSVLVAVQDDLANRTARGNRSEYRLRFPLETNKDNAPDVVSIYSGANPLTSPSITVQYQIP